MNLPAIHGARCYRRRPTKMSLLVRRYQWRRQRKPRNWWRQYWRRSRQRVRQSVSGVCSCTSVWILDRHSYRTLLISDEDLTETVLKKAAKAVGSLSAKEFSISFNPDLYQPKVTHADPESDSLKTDKSMLRELAEFLVFHQIPAFVSVADNRVCTAT